MQVWVRKRNGSLVNFVDAQRKTITLVREQYFDDTDSSTISETVHDLDEKCNCLISLNVAKNEASFSLKVIFLVDSIRWSTAVLRNIRFVHGFYFISFKAKYVNQETDLGMFYTTFNQVADKISLNATILTERYEIFSI